MTSRDREGICGYGGLWNRMEKYYYIDGTYLSQPLSFQSSPISSIGWRSLSRGARESMNSSHQSEIQNFPKSGTNHSFSRIYAFDCCEYSCDLEGYIFSLEIKSAIFIFLIFNL